MGHPRRGARHVQEQFRFLLEGKPHPLIIPSVVNEVADYLSLSELKIFRQVCSQWNNEARKRLRKIGRIVFHNEQILMQYIVQMQNTDYYYENFEFRGEFDSGSNVSIFFTRFGYNIKFLYINRVKWSELKLRKILFDKLPNLEELALEARSYRRLFTGDEIRTLPKIKVLRLNILFCVAELTTRFLQNILRASPNVETISSMGTQKRPSLRNIVHFCTERSYGIADGIVNWPFASDIAAAEAIIEANDITLPKLVNLDFNMQLRGADMDQLTNKHFHLKYLDLTIMLDVTTENLHRLLSSLENSLAGLKLKIHPRCLVSESTAIPPMKKLNCLHLNGYKGSLKILERLPHLETLILIRIDFPRTLFLEEIRFESVCTLKTLEIHEDFCQDCSLSCVEKVCELFPELKSLKLENLTDQTLRMIWVNLPHLTNLNAKNGYFTDSGVTGIPLDVCLAGTDSFDFMNDEDIVREYPYIGDLTSLRSLHLGSPKITDIAIIHGLTKCRTLTQVSLLSNGITDKSLAQLLEMNLFKLETQYCNRLSASGVKYFKERMKGRLVSLNEYKGPMNQNEILNFMRRYGKAVVKVSKLT